MASKMSKSQRKEDRIQQLEKELAETKKKLVAQSKIVRLDDNQMQNFLNELTERLEWSTNRIADETARKTVVVEKNESKDGFSFLMKLLIGFSMLGIAVLMGTVLINNWSIYWSQDWSFKVALVIMGVIVFDFFCLGIEILREKDRNYIVALFSAIVSLVALIVALVM